MLNTFVVWMVQAKGKREKVLDVSMRDKKATEKRRIEGQRCTISIQNIVLTFLSMPENGAHASQSTSSQRPPKKAKKGPPATDDAWPPKWSKKPVAVKPAAAQPTDISTFYKLISL